MSLQLHNGGWQTVEVARAQRELVERELENDALGKPNAPLREFRKVLEWFGEHLKWSFSFLDMGCGVGHYGVLCERYAPKVCYYGTDNSKAMIDQAISIALLYNPTGQFAVSDWYENSYSLYDVILVSQIAEMTENPPKVIEFILERAKRFVILHRLRFVSRERPTVLGRVYEKTYCDYDGQNWIWDVRKLIVLFERCNVVVRYESYWENGATLIVEKLA